MPIRAVILDFNGVVVDDENLHFELFRQALAEEGVALSEADYHSHYLGFDDRGCFSAALADAGRPAPQDLIDALIARKAARYAEAAETALVIFPHAAGTIRALADACPLAICSGALRAEIEFALDRLGVRDCVGSITSAEDTDRCKPDPQGYRIALGRLRERLPDLKADECLVVEDSIAGIEAARAAGMRVVGLSHTYGADELKAAGASTVLAALGDLATARLDDLAPDR